ncbi:hypothetical protein FHW69_001845 [Luteibacter sp. Sphag1AF]|uniref:hypothetical protein n=1 Tax=Luteibacter sp. Sphag1AF TaxID=2587031 RepID=UPI00161C4627|nr:hypothetical protein [Luteibacter sp. Sphag1AF]MBB3227244.1 hypothetical protein [Luteibacter sp. Sphag1AF]
MRARIVFVLLILLWIAAPGVAMSQNCDTPLSPALKTIIYSESSQTMAQALFDLQHASQESIQNHTSGWSGGFGFLGSFKLDGNAGSNSGSTSQQRSDYVSQHAQSLDSDTMNRFRTEFVSSDAWQAYIACVGGQGKLLFASLDAATSGDYDTAVLQLVPVRTDFLGKVVSMDVAGARSFKDWTGAALPSPVGQVILRKPEQPLTVLVSTTLGNFTKTLPARPVLTDVSHTTVALPPPSCNPCDTDKWAFCLGQLQTYWTWQLMNEKRDSPAVDQIVSLRTATVIDTCGAKRLNNVVTDAPPPIPPNLNAQAQNAFTAWREGTTNSARMAMQDYRPTINSLLARLASYGDNDFAADMRGLVGAPTDSWPQPFCPLMITKPLLAAPDVFGHGTGVFTDCPLFR